MYRSVGNAQNSFVRPWRAADSLSLLWGAVEGGGHVDEGGETMQVVAVGMRQDGVGLHNTRGEKHLFIYFLNQLTIFPAPERSHTHRLIHYQTDYSL